LPRGVSQNIRAARLDDLAAIEAIVAAAYGVYVPRMGRKPGPMLDDYAALIGRGLVHVFAQDGVVDGVLVLIPEAEAMLLDNVAVRPAAQGRGVGRALLGFAEAQARVTGYAAIRLYTHETMVENIALYRRIGFVETHRGEESGFRRVYMRKPLDSAPISPSG
jgi:ribosomal protein S18 acetylase RimI-like enzyme